MRVCFFGMGSIGKRHLNNLSVVCKKKNISLNIDVFRNTDKELNYEVKELIENEIFNYDDLQNSYDAIFITNPTSMHYETLKSNLNRTKNFFIEKPVFDKGYNINEIKLRDDGIYYVACPLRYSNVILKLREIIEGGEKPFSVRAISSSYLPDWRPNADYRETYSAIKELGGGVSIDLIHELDYLTYLFGMPDEIIRCIGKYSNLEINSDDLALYICKYKDKLIEVHLDYFGRKQKREVELYCENKLIVGDILRNKLVIGEKEFYFEENPNEKYIREMNYFIECIESGIKTENEIQNAQNVLKLSREDY